MNKNLSTEPYKGTKDYYPQDMILRNHIFDTWKRVAKRFGYEEYDTPLLEETALYRTKSGDEIANNQLYSFVDKGEREIAIRPEMTPSLARIIAAKKNELTSPIRWFNIGKYYRYEKPQKGRRREFCQLNIDILGVQELEAEIEIIQYVLAVMEEFKAPKETYELRINNRYLLDYLFQYILKLKDEQKPLVGRAIDNFNKMGIDEFSAYLKDLGLNEEQIEATKEYLKWELSDLENIQEYSDGARLILELFRKAKDLNITNIRFDPSIMRGFLYYTGTVVEMFDIGSKENPRAIFGGGRYDDLLEIFGQEKIPAFGIGWGDITTEDYLRTYNLVPDIKTDTKVYLPLLDIKYLPKTQDIAKLLRDNNVNTEIQLTPIKIKNQFKYASKRGYPWVLVIGEEEIAQKVVQLKNMKTGVQQTLNINEVIKILRV